MRIQITFRGGAQIEVDLTDETGFDFGQVTGRLTGFSWHTPEDWAYKLFQIDISEVVAMVGVRRPWPWGAPSPSQLMTVTDMNGDERLCHHAEQEPDPS